MSEAISDPGIHRPGRHRRGAGANTWTPAVRPRTSGARHGSPIETADTAPLIATTADTEARYAHYPRQRTRAHARQTASTTATAARQATVTATAESQPTAMTAPEPRTAARVTTATRAATRTATTTTLSGVLPLDELAREPDAWEAAYTFSAAGDADPPAENEPLGHPLATASQAELATEEQPLAEADTEEVETSAATVAASSSEQPSEPTIRRTKVTLTPSEPRRSEPKVYYAPPKDGLSTFDLGTVPASVTPPRSWRKAAWFATVSSGGVVVALLVAASYFVGQPTTDDQIAVDNWTGLRGENPPPMHNENLNGAPERTTSASPETSSKNVIADRAAVIPSTSRAPMSKAPQPTSAPESQAPATSAATSATPTTTNEPQKPPPSSAPRETRSDYFYRFPPDAETMGDRSEIFLNQITENPEKAHEQTGGDLYAEGAESIAARYSHIAYFEIEHIYIDQRNRVTVNTVKAVFTDGTTERQQRTLRFEEGDKITDD
ncbi:hypothetical protein [Haloechinothrix halophila]|uniref:Uncharacterized protein n=1 Tax=Haloechinothrix halophila YIM 93223 TaxID=592678 RepID=W9DN78_9PSEU|nr:hypothetical protein [Haloechinothrix halophila]ETA66320.1 hypothetical protein AmyhaDRAFT_0074 [Haloechinothrix halophila YIM 93223]